MSRTDPAGEIPEPPTFTLEFTTIINAATPEEAQEAYEAMIAAAINISNSQPTAEVCVLEPEGGELTE